MRARSCAAESPTGPPPTTATLKGSLFCPRPALMSTGRFDSGPCRSVRKRLSARIAMGRSISPRRQAVSQGCAQTRPQILASGLGSRANLYASSNRPSEMSATYRPALVWAGQAIMQGKLVFNQSLSTFLSLNRFSKTAIPQVSGTPGVPARLDGRDARRSIIELFAQCEIRFTVARHSHRLGFALGAFMPCGYGVAAIGNIVDFVDARFVGQSKVRGRRHNDIAGHLRVDVAEKRHGARIVELERTLFALRPCAQVVSKFLIAADGRPEHVVGDIVAIEELHGRADLHRYDMRLKHQALLVDHGLLRGSGEGLAGWRFHVNNRLAANARNFAADRASAGNQAHDCYYCHHHHETACHFSLLVIFCSLWICNW